MSGEWKFKQENMPRQTAKQKTDCTLTRRLADYAAGAAYPFHMPGHKRRPGALGGAVPEALDITEIDGFDDLHEEWYYADVLRATSAYDDNGYVDIEKRAVRNNLDDYED